jgi:hypothetical protein
VDRMKMLCFQEHRVNSPLPGYCMASDWPCCMYFFNQPWRRS